MQAIEYEGYFRNGRFYTSGKVLQLPEQRRVVVTLFDDAPKTNVDKLAAWEEAKRMIAESAHENHLLTDDIFKRDKSSRDLILFADEGNTP